MGLPDPDETGDLLRPMGAPDAAPPPPPAPPPPALQTQGHAPGCSCHAAAPDALDALADDLAGEWQEAVDPMLDPVKRLLGEVGSLEEFRDRLAALIGEMDTTAFEELLVRGTFSARLAGRLEADLDRD